MRPALPTVELVWAHPTPELETLRTALQTALPTAGLPAQWQEWQADDPWLPAHQRRHATPVGLYVNGWLVPAGATSGPELGRRISNLTRQRARQGARMPWSRRIMPLLPSIWLVLLPKCPICWAAYAGAFSSLGLAPVAYQRWWLPATGAMLLLALASMCYRAPARHGYGPALLGLAGAALTIAGKLLYASNWLLWPGLLVILASVGWNAALPKRRPGLGLG